MLISGIQQFTMLDYPRKLACIIFLSGCDFRCGYCHNAQFVLPEKINKIKTHFIPKEAVLHFLQQRKDKLDGVVISGGEPTLSFGLDGLIKEIKEMGYFVKLDTNGHQPQKIAELLEHKLIDYIAMDIKSDLENYQKLTNSCIKVDNIVKSIDLIKQSSIDYEFRTTVINEIHNNDVLQKMIPLVKDAKCYALQTFRPQKTLDPVYSSYHGPSEHQLNEINQLFSPYVQELIIRI